MEHSSQTVPELVEQFRVLALAKSQAIDEGKTAKYNRLYWKLDAVEKALKAREGDQRRALVPLYDHPNPQVRLDAAMATLVVFPEKARVALEMIWERNEFRQAANAKSVLLSMSERRFTPE